MAKKFIERTKVLEMQKTFTEYDEGGWDAAVRAVPVDAISKIPAADVVEVKHGEWIKLDMCKGMEDFKCSICQSSCYVPTCMGEPMYAFCPNCGNPMDGGNENE